MSIVKMFDNGCDVVILACNTATVVALEHVQEFLVYKNYFHKKVVSISHSFLDIMDQEYDFLRSQTGVLFATRSTYDSGFYQRHFHKRGFGNIYYDFFENLAKNIEIGDFEAVDKEIQKN